MRELWIETWRSIVAHRVRFALTSLGIGWGAFMLTTLSANLAGFEQHWTSEYEEIGPRMVMMGSGVVLKPRVGERGARAVELEVEDVQRAEALESIEHATPEIGLWSVPWTISLELPPRSLTR